MASGSAPKESQIGAVIRNCLRRRHAGETIRDEQIISEHPELMPELQRSLSKLALIQIAFDKAQGSTTGGVDNEPRIPDNVIPGYDLLGELHRGGQGIVFQAVQCSTDRVVAIKVMREGPFFGSRDRARFEREVRILGQLRHPNIVTIFDSGVTAGSHWFVMDYVPGPPIDAYASANGLTLRDTLTLFVKVCDAVNAAHVHGVIHRDLKPGNILVDDRGEPRVLDFGLAKIEDTGSDGPAPHSAMTVTGQFLGSLPWASPEQADGDSTAVDIRTDVYSMGVILYQLVTGRMPFAADRGRATLLRNIVEAEPLAASASCVGVDEDINTIVMKCLAKHPRDRYQSASALADDIGRYLNNQPILARAPSLVYQMRKLVRRHRLAALLSTFLLLSLIGFGIGMTILYHRESKAQARAELRRQEAEGAAATLSAVNEFLLNDILSASSPELAQGRDVTMREILDEAAGRIETSLTDQPEIKAAVLATIGRSYARLGLFEKAESHLRNASEQQRALFGPHDRRTLETEVELAEALKSLERHQDAKALVVRIREERLRALSPEDAIALRADALDAWYLRLDGKSTESLLLMQDMIERARQSSERHPAVSLALMNDWVPTMRAWHQPGWEDFLQESLQLARRRLGQSHPQTLRAMTNMGSAFAEWRQFREATELLEEAHSVQTRILGPNHVDTLYSAMRLGRLYLEANQLDDAENLFQASLERAKATLEPAHTLVLDLHSDLANSMMRQSRDCESLAILQEALDVCVPAHGPQHGNSFGLLGLRCLVLYRLGRYADAEPCLRAVLEYDLSENKDPASHDPANTMRQLNWCLAARGKSSEAREIAARMLERRKLTADLPDASAYMFNSLAKDLLNVEPPDMRDPELALVYALKARDASTEEYHYNRFTIASAYHQLGRFELALEFVQNALANSPLEDTIERRLYEDLYAEVQEALGDPAAALASFAELVELRQDQFGPDHPDVATAMERYGAALIRRKELAEAESFLRDALDIRSRAMPDAGGCIGRNMSLLGEALARQGLFEEARQHLVGGYERMRDDADGSWTDLHAALQRLVKYGVAVGLEDSVEDYENALVSLAQRMGIQSSQDAEGDRNP